MKPICDKCFQDLVEIRPKHWLCPNGCSKVIRARDLEPYVAAAYKKWEESPEGQAALARFQDIVKKRDAREKNRQKRAKELAALPAAFETALQYCYKLEGSDGLFRRCGWNSKGAVKAVILSRRRSIWLRPATHGETESILETLQNLSP